MGTGPCWERDVFDSAQSRIGDIRDVVLDLDLFVQEVDLFVQFGEESLLQLHGAITKDDRTGAHAQGDQIKDLAKIHPILHHSHPASESFSDCCDKSHRSGSPPKMKNRKRMNMNASMMKNKKSRSVTRRESR
jgi:hypothetical protein